MTSATAPIAPSIKLRSECCAIFPNHLSIASVYHCVLYRIHAMDLCCLTLQQGVTIKVSYQNQLLFYPYE